jgi:hypothetical protein
MAEPAEAVTHWEGEILDGRLRLWWEDGDGGENFGAFGLFCASEADTALVAALQPNSWHAVRIDVNLCVDRIDGRRFETRPAPPPAWRHRTACGMWGIDTQ